MLNYKLPFYEKKGSIAAILETESDYQVWRYKIDGKIEQESSHIKKTSSNKQALLNEFFTNVEEWLTTNKNKYEELIANNPNKLETKSVLNKQNTMIILILSIIIGICPLATSIILESASLWTIGAGTFISGAAFTTASIIRLNSIKFEEKNTKFKNKYESMQHELKIYNAEELTPKSTSKKEKSNIISLTPRARTNNPELPLIKTKKQVA